MKIETDDWVAAGDAARESGVPQTTFYRAAHRLGLMAEFFGTKCIRKKDVAKVVAAKRERGNPDWIGSYDEARKAARLAVKSRLKRIEREGLTEAEASRGERIKAALSRRSGGLPSVATPAE